MKKGKNLQGKAIGLILADRRNFCSNKIMCISHVYTYCSAKNPAF